MTAEPPDLPVKTQLFGSTSGGSDSSALLFGRNVTREREVSHADVITTPNRP